MLKNHSTDQFQNQSSMKPRRLIKKTFETKPFIFIKTIITSLPKTRISNFPKININQGKKKKKNR